MDQERLYCIPSTREEFKFCWVVCSFGFSARAAFWIISQPSMLKSSPELAKNSVMISQTKSFSEDWVELALWSLLLMLTMQMVSSWVDHTPSSRWCRAIQNRLEHYLVSANCLADNNNYGSPPVACKSYNLDFSKISEKLLIEIHKVVATIDYLYTAFKGKQKTKAHKSSVPIL